MSDETRLRSVGGVRTAPPSSWSTQIASTVVAATLLAITLAECQAEDGQTPRRAACPMTSRSNQAAQEPLHVTPLRLDYGYTVEFTDVTSRADLLDEKVHFRFPPLFLIVLPDEAIASAEGTIPLMERVDHVGRITGVMTFRIYQPELVSLARRHIEQEHSKYLKALAARKRMASLTVVCRPFPLERIRIRAIDSASGDELAVAVRDDNLGTLGEELTVRFVFPSAQHLQAFSESVRQRTLIFELQCVFRDEGAHHTARNGHIKCRNIAMPTCNSDLFAESVQRMQTSLGLDRESDWNSRQNSFESTE